MSRTAKSATVLDPQPVGTPRVAGSKALHPRYRADIGAGSLKVSESRTIAKMLLDGTDEDRWRAAIQDENVLQARSRKTGKRLASLLRARLKTMSPDLWSLITNGSMLLSTHACLAAAVKHSPLLGDFLDLVVREQYRLFRPALTYPMWEHYIEDCRSRDTLMSAWSESTSRRLRSAVFGILAEAGYIENVRSLKLQKVFIAKEILAYLKERDEQYVLRCIQVGP